MMILFALYFVLNLVCFTLRPGPCMLGLTNTKKANTRPPQLSTPPRKPPALNLLTDNATDGTNTTIDLLDGLWGNDAGYSTDPVEENSEANKAKDTAAITTESSVSTDVPEIPAEEEVAKAEAVEENNQKPSLDPSTEPPDLDVTVEDSSNTTSSEMPPTSTEPPTESTVNKSDECRCTLMEYNTPQDAVRWGLEILVFAGTILYILDAIYEARFLGIKMFLENLVSIDSVPLTLTPVGVI